MKILLPVDGSKPALNATRYAAKLVRNLRTKAVITLVNVHDDAGFNHVKQFVSKAVVDDFLREISERQLKPAQKILDQAGARHNIAIKRGHISEEILNLADQEQFDLIVMGAKGRSGFVDVLVGSVAQRIVNSAKQPVLLIK